MSTVELDKKLLSRLSARKVSLEELESLEKKCVLESFHYEDAFQLGMSVRKAAKDLYPESFVAIDVSSSNGHCLFRTITFQGSSLDNDFWIERKRKSVLRFGHSSFYLGNKMQGKTPEEKFFVDSKEYAFHGGAIPIFLEKSDYPVACLTVSGLKQEEDHLLATTCAINYAEQAAQHGLELD
ncbi:hypothetical protein HG535_0C03070 [Zygotorulaspora mrakii]|uniref:Uncharacterized protein n=1 Tax=Zygotorulaspora mrakii TaxID=42260 RepID=A0A7H9AZT0_ZYGMR|nr:uncharacterized protein HG535_0C03070 [Zygotorulaspora mrakii]QLG71955.1 hypothetical protein HG535_0C03070 [Zygotorulaspora mrakii]